MIDKAFLERERADVLAEAEKARVLVIQCQTAAAIYDMLIAKLEEKPSGGDLPEAS